MLCLGLADIAPHQPGKHKPKQCVLAQGSWRRTHSRANCGSTHSGVVLECCASGCCSRLRILRAQDTRLCGHILPPMPRNRCERQARCRQLRTRQDLHHQKQPELRCRAMRSRRASWSWRIICCCSKWTCCSSCRNHHQVARLHQVVSLHRVVLLHQAWVGVQRPRNRP